MSVVLNGLVYLLPLVSTGLIFPSRCKFCACVCVRLIQVSAGWSRCKLVTQIHTCRPASPPGAPLCGPINSNHPLQTHRYSALNALPTHTHTHTQQVHRGLTTRLVRSAVYYITITVRIVFVNFTPVHDANLSLFIF